MMTDEICLVCSSDKDDNGLVICSLCNEEEGEERHRGVIACDSCYLSEGEGKECERCGVIEHIDHISLGLCQPCEDKAIYYGGRR